MVGPTYAQIQVGEVTWHVAITQPMKRYNMWWYKTTEASRARGDTVGAKGHLEISGRIRMMQDRPGGLARWMIGKGIPIPVARYVARRIATLDAKAAVRNDLHRKRIEESEAHRLIHKKILARVDEQLKPVAKAPKATVVAPKAIAVVPKKVLVKVAEQSQWEIDRKEAYDSLPTLDWDTTDWVLPKKKGINLFTARIGLRILFVIGSLAYVTYLMITQ